MCLGYKGLLPGCSTVREDVYPQRHFKTANHSPLVREERDKAIDLRVLSWSSLASMFSAMLDIDLFKGKWSLAKSYLKQNYCHPCHTRFAVFFPLPSCCVSSSLFFSLVLVWLSQRGGGGGELLPIHLTPCKAISKGLARGFVYWSCALRKIHRSTVLRRNKNMAVEGGTVPHYYFLVIRKFIDFMSLFRQSVWFSFSVKQFPSEEFGICNI